MSSDQDGLDGRAQAIVTHNVRHFHLAARYADIIQLCVRWYLTDRLSYRYLVKLMAERGIPVAHSTMLRWVNR